MPITPLQVFVLDDELNLKDDDGKPKYRFLRELEYLNFIKFEGVESLTEAINALQKAQWDIALVDINMGSDDNDIPIYSDGSKYTKSIAQFKGRDTIIGGVIISLAFAAQKGTTVTKVFTGKEQEFFEDEEHPKSLKALYVLSALTLQRLGIPHFSQKGFPVKTVFESAVEEWRESVIDYRRGAIGFGQGVNQIIEQIDGIKALFIAEQPNRREIVKKLNSLFQTSKIGLKMRSGAWREMLIGSIFPDKYWRFFGETEVEGRPVLTDIESMLEETFNKCVNGVEPGYKKAWKPALDDMKKWLLKLQSGSYQVWYAVGGTTHFKITNAHEACQLLEPFFDRDETQELWGELKKHIMDEKDLHDVFINASVLPKPLQGCFGDGNICATEFFRIKVPQEIVNLSLENVGKETLSHYVYGNAFMLKEGLREISLAIKESKKFIVQTPETSQNLILILWDNAGGIDDDLDKLPGESIPTIRRYMAEFVERLIIVSQSRSRTQAYDIKYDDPHLDPNEFSGYTANTIASSGGTLFLLEFAQRDKIDK